MDRGALAARNALAEQRIITAALALSGHEMSAEIAAYEAVAHRDPEVKAMLKREAVAAVFEAIVAVTPKAKRVLAELREAAAEPIDEPDEPEPETPAEPIIVELGGGAKGQRFSKKGA